MRGASLLVLLTACELQSEPCHGVDPKWEVVAKGDALRYWALGDHIVMATGAMTTFGDMTVPANHVVRLELDGAVVDGGEAPVPLGERTVLSEYGGATYLASSRQLVAFSPDLVELWRMDALDPAVLDAGPDGTVLVLMEQSRTTPVLALRLLDASGELWSLPYTSSLVVARLNSQHEAWILAEDRIYRVSANGSTTTATFTPTWGGTIERDGTSYAFLYPEPYLDAYGSDGTKLWRGAMRAEVHGVAVGTDGNLVATLGDGRAIARVDADTGTEIAFDATCFGAAPSYPAHAAIGDASGYVMAGSTTPSETHFWRVDGP